MQPMKITAVMQDGRVAGTDPWFPLDSILASVWIRRNYPELAYLPIQNTHDIITAELPLEKRGQGDNWYWACSFNQSKKLNEYVTHWHKRFDDDKERYLDFQDKRGKINTQSAKYKAYRMPLVIQVFDRLTWYAVGDIELVRSLCQGVTHIGKKTSQGFGAVDYWSVEPWLEDWSENGPNGLTRAIPLKGNMQAGNIQKHTIRPPYWLQDNSRVCIMPEEL